LIGLIFHFGSLRLLGIRTIAIFPFCMSSEYSVLASPSIAACKAAAAFSARRHGPA